MDAWNELIASSTITTGDAWEHLINQGGGIGEIDVTILADGLEIEVMADDIAVVVDNGDVDVYVDDDEVAVLIESDEIIVEIKNG